MKSSKYSLILDQDETKGQELQLDRNYNNFSGELALQRWLRIEGRCIVGNFMLNNDLFENEASSNLRALSLLSTIACLKLRSSCSENFT